MNKQRRSFSLAIGARVQLVSLLNLADVLAMNINGTEYDITFSMEGAENYITY